MALPGHEKHTSGSHEYNSPVNAHEPYHPAAHALLVSYSPPLLKAIASDDWLLSQQFSSATELNEFMIACP